MPLFFGLLGRVCLLEATLKNADMEKLLERRRVDCLNFNKMKTWAGEHCPQLRQELAHFGVRPAICFWYSLSGKRSVPDAIYNGLRSCIVARLLPVLYAYQEFDNIPHNVEVRNAAELLPEREFQFLLTKFGNQYISLLADYVRLLAMDKGIHPVSVFWDCDTIGVQPVDSLDNFDDAGSLHWFATMGCNPGMQGGSSDELYWMRKFFTKPRDKRWAATPFQAPRGSPIIKALLDFMYSFLKREYTQEQLADKAFYNTFMDEYRRQIVLLGLHGAVLEVSAFSPLPAYKRGKVIAAQRGRDDDLVDLQTIFRTSFGVNNFWQSGKRLVNEAVAHGADSRIHPNSLWADLLAAVRREADKKQDNGVTMERPPKRLRRKMSDPRLPTAALEWPKPLVELPPFQSWPSSAFSHNPFVFKYSLECPIGHGTFGQVFRAKPNSRVERVAVKVVHAKDVMTPIEAQELYFHRKCMEQPHECILAMLDAWASPYSMVIITELMDMDCNAAVKKLPSKHLQEHQAAFIIQHVASGLHY